MSRIYAGLAMFALSVVAGAGPAAPAFAETATGSVYVTTLPSGADIWIDGVYVGRAPVLIDALAPGRHAMTITKTGWVTDEVDVSVNAAAIAMSSTHLMAGPTALASTSVGTVVLRGVPTGTVLELDGAAFDATPGRDLTMPAGRHKITATTPHGSKYTRSITVLPDTATEVVLSEPASSDARSVVVAAAEDYLPTDNFTLEGKKIVVRYGGHVVVAYLGEQQMRIDGAPVSYDGAPQAIEGKLYLPLALLEKLTGDTSNGR